MQRPFLIHHAVERAAERHGDRPAVRCDGAQLTHAELAARVHQLARSLVELGVARGDRVGVLLHKSVETMVSVHAILRAGAAYVPLDPLSPVAAWAAVVADCGIETIVSDDRTVAPRAEELAAACPGLRRLVGLTDRVPGLDTVTTADLAGHAGATRLPATLADDLAYIMYTSGSTGAPKGIMHTHRSGLRYAELAADTYGLSADDRLANIAPLHFDQSTFELFAGPLAGACSVLVPTPVVRMPASLAALLADEAITIWYSVPSILVQLLERGAIERHDLSSLRWVLFGGEVFPPDALARMMRRWGHARFSNVYGPAEVNQCTFHHLDEPPAGDGPVPIGHAWDDTEVIVVDEEGREIVGGDRGELLVRTSTMMRGYWNQPALTARRLVERPLVGGTGRWYATGDLVERRPDGALVFVGRSDRQVKVRGNRVELEAVEAAIGRVEGVAQSAVTIAELDGEQQLVAALVVSPTAAGLDERTLRRALARELPPYAVPDRFVLVDALPVTPSGKVDTGAVTELVRVAGTGAGAEVNRPG